MHPDTISVILRSASFIALFQAAGMAIFLAMFGRPLGASLASMRRINRLSATAAVVLLVGQYALEAARMADDMSGMVDPSLQMMAMHSASSVVLAMRLLGLVVIAMAVGRRGEVGLAFSVIGAGVVAASFMLTGHTAAKPAALGIGAAAHRPCADRDVLVRCPGAALFDMRSRNGSHCRASYGGLLQNRAVACAGDFDCRTPIGARADSTSLRVLHGLWHIASGQIRRIRSPDGTCRPKQMALRTCDQRR